MVYRSYVTLNVAIVGNTKVAEELTFAFLAAGHNVCIAGGPGASENEIASNYDTPNLYRCTIEEAASFSDFIIIATEPQNVREVAYWLGDVRNKVIVDLTPNVSATSVPEQHEHFNSAKAISAITGARDIVKVFNFKRQYKLFKPLFDGKKVDMLLAGDSLKAKEITKILMRECGMSHFYDFGGSDSHFLLDEMAPTWRTMIAEKSNFNQPIGISK